MNLDDKALFLDAMEDVQPLKRHTDVHWQPWNFVGKDCSRVSSTSYAVGNTLSRPASICYASRSKRAEKCCFVLSWRRRKRGCVMS